MNYSMNRVRTIVCLLLVSLLLIGGVIAADITLSFIVGDDAGKAKSHVDDVADYTGWTAKVVNPANPTGPQIDNISKKNWVEKKAKEWFKECVKAQRANKKADTARAAEIIQVEAEVVFK